MSFPSQIADKYTIVELLKKSERFHTSVYKCKDDTNSPCVLKVFDTATEQRPPEIDYLQSFQHSDFILRYCTSFSQREHQHVLVTKDYELADLKKYLSV